MDDDWGDAADETRMQRRASHQRRREPGLSREQRFTITLAAAAALMLVIGIGIGFAVGRATATNTPTQPQIAPVATTTVEATASAEPTASTEPTGIVEPTPTVVATPPVETQPPKTPPPLSPDDGARINADRVTLRWSKVSDPSGGAVTYAFEIQTYSGGAWGSAQTIKGLKSPSYSVRVLTSNRRWRVWAVGSDGKASVKSDWNHYRHT